MLSLSSHLLTHTEGTQLLCLIDKGLDACRYLQTYGEWQQSVWLAKATLSERDCSEVFTRWVDHLSSVGVNQKVSHGNYQNQCSSGSS